MNESLPEQHNNQENLEIQIKIKILKNFGSKKYVGTKMTRISKKKSLDNTKRLQIVQIISI